MEQREHSGLEAKYLNLSYSIKALKKRFGTHMFSLIGAQTYIQYHTESRTSQTPTHTLVLEGNWGRIWLTHVAWETEDSEEEGPCLNPQRQLVHGTSGQRVETEMVAIMSWTLTVWQSLNFPPPHCQPGKYVLSSPQTEKTRLGNI